MDKNLYAVILAGGSGTRFWPLSRSDNPKQFLSIIGDQSLLRLTLARIRPIIKGSNIFIVTNKRYVRQVKEQTKGFRVPRANILLEPKGKNTAPAIAWAAARIYEKNHDAVLLVLPSDHLIQNRPAYLRYLKQAVRLARRGYLVTLGLIPTRPETGYGYLQTKRMRTDGGHLWRVERFTEKPTLARARKFIRKKNYFWNSGMFIWGVEIILKAYQQHLPRIYRCFKDKSHPAHVGRIWPQLPSISVDYGILEKARNVVTVPAQNVGWSDVGSWESLAEVVVKDAKGVASRGKVITSGCHDSLIYGQKRLIAAIGLNDVVIVDTDDALLVCHKKSSQDVRRIVELLKKKKNKV